MEQYWRRGGSCVSTALINENNKVTTLYLSGSKIGEDCVKHLSAALMNENNKVITLTLSGNKIRSEGSNLYQLQ